jgi:hypothetical protein
MRGAPPWATTITDAGSQNTERSGVVVVRQSRLALSPRPLASPPAGKGARTTAHISVSIASR